MTDFMNAKKRLSFLEAELDAQGIVASLSLLDDAIYVRGSSKADELLAKSELRKMGVILWEPFRPEGLIATNLPAA